ncbi:transmembrane protein 100 [Tachysurus vachellii]|uniref:transmembrane protein 100 n=1 Tax=Tachysurus vachellii TaxID=175792 RepID=UPI00296A9108|nr:transmembrane protein 100 [Tachysurus vachellii]
MPEDTVKDTMTIPECPSLTVKANNNNKNDPPPSVSIPLVNDGPLTAATGGTELSCFRCTLPFGVVVLIAGIVVTAVAYSLNSHGSTISHFGLALLSAGVALLGLSAGCWKLRSEKKKEERRRESQAALVTNHRII